MGALVLPAHPHLCGISPESAGHLNPLRVARGLFGVTYCNTRPRGPQPPDVSKGGYPLGVTALHRPDEADRGVPVPGFQPWPRRIRWAPDQRPWRYLYLTSLLCAVKIYGVA